MNEVQQELLDITGTWVSLPTICKTAHRLVLTRQKMKKIAIRRSEVLRAKYMAEIEEFDPDMIVFLDETGCDKRSSIRQFGYGLRGITPVTHKLDIYRKRISAIGVMTTRGIEDAYLIEGNVNVGTFYCNLFRGAC